jgi:hypothetical protein
MDTPEQIAEFRRPNSVGSTGIIASIHYLSLIVLDTYRENADRVFPACNFPESEKAPLTVVNDSDMSAGLSLTALAVDVLPL